MCAGSKLPYPFADPALEPPMSGLSVLADLYYDPFLFSKLIFVASLDLYSSRDPEYLFIMSTGLGPDIIA